MTEEAPTFRAFGDDAQALDVAALLDAVVADPAPVVDGRPRTIGVMVASVDGHATLRGRSGGLGGPEDRAVFRGLRAHADALLVGPTTLNRERYGTVLDPPHRAARAAQGRAPEPLLATVSRSLRLDEDVPLLRESLNRTVIYSESVRSFLPDAERVEVVRIAEATPPAALADLHRRGVRLVNCEGGPTLLAGLLRAGVLDELLLTVSPLVIGGDAPLTILHGALAPSDAASGAAAPVPLALRGVWRGGDVLFLHYHRSSRSAA